MPLGIFVSAYQENYGVNHDRGTRPVEFSTATDPQETRCDSCKLLKLRRFRDRSTPRDAEDPRA